MSKSNVRPFRDTVSPVTRTSTGLRGHLFDTLDALRGGNITPQEASATARICQQIHNTARLEMESARFLSAMHHETDDNGLVLTPLQLDAPDA